MVNYCSTYMRKKVHLFINAKTLYGIPKIWKFLRYLIFANPSNKAMDKFLHRLIFFEPES